MIECYTNECPWHEANQIGGIEGPFCSMDECIQDTYDETKPKDKKKEGGEVKVESAGATG